MSTPLPLPLHPIVLSPSKNPGGRGSGGGGGSGYGRNNNNNRGGDGAGAGGVTEHSSNINGGNIQLIKAVVCAGLYPNVTVAPSALCPSATGNAPGKGPKGGKGGGGGAGGGKTAGEVRWRGEGSPGWGGRRRNRTSKTRT